MARGAMGAFAAVCLKSHDSGLLGTGWLGNLDRSSPICRQS
ncbi:hypothetical protein Z946_2936 [Sulfitobacter noctilucicola]|nr:hypothetical protein Z946_2936 [Sulfitobacter noctilucicola]